MRQLLCIFLLLCTQVANAGCDLIAQHTDKHLFIDITDGYCETATKIKFAPVKNGKTIYENMKELDFYAECKVSESGEQFTCRTNNANPLSGATYKLYENGTMDCGSEIGNVPDMEYRCIKGCKGVPRKLENASHCD